MDGDPKPDGGPKAEHLLLTEVKTEPDEQEFIEIFNPTDTALSLADYYLSDDPSYCLLPTWGEEPPTPGNFDAVMRFPPGAVIEPGSAIVVARDDIGFANTFGFPPDFAIKNAGSAQSMILVAHGSQLDMALAENGEALVLFTWDGERDLVSDVDMVIPGNKPDADGRLQPKQQVAPGGVDGPDADSIPTSYWPDAATMPNMRDREGAGGSYQRIRGEGEHELATGGNGVTGHDETSEDTQMTWERDKHSVPNPGQVELQ